eukprot:Hpha_TRINITY_DN11480_c0_g1::TRINITY_DN11480_c0_g1_i2::g.137420::m.137420/K03977/engA, der; GTPase
MGFNKMGVTSVAGTTREAVSFAGNFRGKRIRLFDTPGMNRMRDRWLLCDPKQNPGRARKEKVGHWMHTATIRAVRWASVVLYVFDARGGLGKQQVSEARSLLQHGRPVVLVANKWDEVEAKLESAQAFDKQIQSDPHLRGSTIVCLSARRGLNLTLLMDTVLDHHKRWHTRVPTGRLNVFWHKIQATLHIQVNRSKVRHIIQVASTPPTFVVFLSSQHILQGSLLRYLMNSIRKEFGLNGIPFRVVQKRKPPSMFNMLGYNRPEKVYQNAPREGEKGAKTMRRWGDISRDINLRTRHPAFASANSVMPKPH